MTVTITIKTITIVVFTTSFQITMVFTELNHIVKSRRGLNEGIKGSIYTNQLFVVIKS